MALLSPNLPWAMANPRWAAILNPIISSPTVNPTILKDVELKAGVNVINHLLGRMQQGWIIVDQQESALIHRSADFNSTTLTLTSSDPCTISLAVF